MGWRGRAQVSAQERWAEGLEGQLVPHSMTEAP